MLGARHPTAGPKNSAVRDLRLCSPHRIDRLLGVRHGALALPLKSHRVRSEAWIGRLKIPASEVARLASEGLTEAGRRPRAQEASGSGNTDPAALRALRLEDL